MAAKYLGIDHLGIAVTDLEAAIRTYRDILGFEISGGEILEGRGLDVRFVNTGSSRLELMGATRDDSEISAFLAKRGEGMHHVSVRVDDIETAVNEMRERGAQVIGDITGGAGGTRVVFIHPKATHGVLIELVEHPSEEP